MYQPNRNGLQLESNGYKDYRDPKGPDKGLGSAGQSFASAIMLLSKLSGGVPEEVVVISVL
ncbi:hypothetical protein [Hymenobacter volaticus]|nr:hypothetical protein [Hymenobacter volaticus]